MYRVAILYCCKLSMDHNFTLIYGYSRSAKQLIAIYRSLQNLFHVPVPAVSESLLSNDGLTKLGFGSRGRAAVLMHN